MMLSASVLIGLRSSAAGDVRCGLVRHRLSSSFSAGRRRRGSWAPSSSSSTPPTNSFWKSEQRRFLPHCSSTVSWARFLSSPSSSPPPSSSSPPPLSSLSPRDRAALEERILSALSSSSPSSAAVDLVLGRSVRGLGWVGGVLIPRGSPPAGAGAGAALSFSPLGVAGAGTAGEKDREDKADGSDDTDDDDAVVISLILPSLLHPFLDEVREGVRSAAADAIVSFLSEHSGGEGGSGSGSGKFCHDPPVVVRVSTRRPSPGGPTGAYSTSLDDLGPALANVSHLLAVYSCKGGVGKSTVAVNLAYELSRKGGRVGLLDCDVYGPSLPVLVRPSDLAVRRSPRGSAMVYPIEHENVRLMSLGYVSPNSGVPGSGGADGEAAVMRGPMASRVLAQLLKGTDWGDLDVLVLDLPPGTGDVQLTLCQDAGAAALSGAVCVTTPSELAAVDARKGVEMFRRLGIPTVAAVENMSYFDCPGGGRHYPFGRGLLGEEEEEGAVGNGGGGSDGDKGNEEGPSLFGLDPSGVFRLPISSHANGANDAGAPLCLSRPPEASEEIRIFCDLADRVSEQLLRIGHGLPPSGVAGFGGGSEDFDGEAITTFDGDAAAAGGTFEVGSLSLSADADARVFVVRLFSDCGAVERRIDAEVLRYTDPVTGARLGEDEAAPPPGGGRCGSGRGQLEVESAKSADGGVVELHRHVRSPRLFPARVEKKGRYGYAVDFADGATIIFSLTSLARAAGGTLEARKG